MSDQNKGGQDKAKDIRDKISASQSKSRSRSSQRKAAADAGQPLPPDTRGLVEKTVDEHPLALLAGSLVLGVVAANLLQASFGRRVAGKLLGAVAVAGELGAAAGSKTLGAAAEAGRAGQEKLSHLGDTVAAEGAEVRRRAKEMSREARRRALALATEAASEARDAGGSALQRLRKFGSRR